MPSSEATRLLDPQLAVTSLLWSDDFCDLTQWVAELECGGTVEAHAGKLSVDVPGGATIWFKPCIEGPVLIQYKAKVVQNGGPNDRASDLNCFWMARDARSSSDIFGFERSGQFADYNLLLAYYVGLGGNSNTTTRFRRYIGDAEDRPLRPEHDLRAPENLIVPNREQTLQLVASGPLVQFYRDQNRLFEMHDSQPYLSGWFGLRTVTSHLEIREFRVYRLQTQQRPAVERGAVELAL